MALPFRTNKINRTFVIEVALYYNEDSWNRPGDATPRYWLKPIKLLNVERVGHTYESRDKGYAKYGHRYWRYKPEEDLTNEQVEEYYEKIKNSYPYGYVEGDIASEAKYRLDVKEHLAFQSYYQTYWDNNLDKVSLPKKTLVGNMDHEYPYIKFTANEAVFVKHNVGVVPTLETGVPLYAEYGGAEAEDHYNAPYAWSCYEENIDVTVNNYLPEYGLPYVFHLNSQAVSPLILSNSGKTTSFFLTSGMYSNSIYNVWPTGLGGVHSGIKLAFSTGQDGTWGGHDELTAGLTKYEQQDIYTYYVSVAPKEGDPETGHPYYGSGYASGYVISGEGIQSGPLTLERGRGYFFTQTGASNSGHPLYVAYGLYTGEGTGIIEVGQSGFNDHGEPTQFLTSSIEWTSDVSPFVPWTTAAELTTGMLYSGNEGTAFFYLDWSAPDTLYYQSRNAAQVGGLINVVDPTAVDGDKPVDVIRLTSTGNKDDVIYYYSPFATGMGGPIYLKKQCDGLPVELP